MYNPNGIWGCTESHRDTRNPIFIPEVKIETVDPAHHYEAQCGFSASLAVFTADGACVGWIDTRTLGYECARDWMAARDVGPVPS